MNYVRVNHDVKLILLLLLSFATEFAHTRAQNCCELTEKQLQDMRGRSDSCPSSFTVQYLSNKCSDCDAHTCRVNFRCYCPAAFLSSSFSQETCEESFLHVWPQSIGKGDRDWRSCAPNFEPPKPSTASCCQMTEKQLGTMVGTSDDCPSSMTVTFLSDKCRPCPPGTCRINLRCYCPLNFLHSTFHQAQCSDSFGEPWPNSIGMEDKDWRGCDNRTESTGAGGTSAAESASQGGQGSSADGTSSTSTESPSSSATATSSGSKSENTINVENSNSQPSNDEEANSLSTLEVVGIVAGVVSAIVTVIGGLAALRKRKHPKGGGEVGGEATRQISRTL
eukprot:TRINITY_DN5053_c0_g3_i1.p1 TRINITY_DN5053_c0_g3~~TRINITY_DN5053_c0_g3_i1.p1  ORF type:complete len:336 (-),score=26.53 TRINITY_DN5053_c0_g3_i1:513-1520(-)